MNNYTPLLNIMAKAAFKAGRVLSRDFGEVENMTTSSKRLGDFVTKSDKLSEKIIFEELNTARPKYSFLMEEQGEVVGSDTSNTWVIDPIDGTSNFIHGFPMFCISIALVRDTKPFAGVIYNPIYDQMWLAEVGFGAWMLNKRLRVSRRKDITSCFSYSELPNMYHNELQYEDLRARLLKRSIVLSRYGGSVRHFGSSALALASFASAQFDAVFLEGVSPWDIAAGMVIASEAGGLIRDFDGGDKMLDNGSIVATNGHMDAQLKSLFEKSNMKWADFA